MQLQEELGSTENRLAATRRSHNDSVLSYNTKIQTFPTTLPLWTAERSRAAVTCLKRPPAAIRCRKRLISGTVVWSSRVIAAFRTVLPDSFFSAAPLIREAGIVRKHRVATEIPLDPSSVNPNMVRVAANDLRHWASTWSGKRTLHESRVRRNYRLGSKPHFLQLDMLTL